MPQRLPSRGERVILGIMHTQGLVDAHLHLQDYDAGTDVSGVIGQAVEAGVSHLACNGTEEDDWPAVLGYAREFPRVIPCFGLHPWFVGGGRQGWADRLEELIAGVPSGVGEIGLDKLHIPFDKSLQEEAFRVQLRIATRHGRPAMLHCVRCWGWLMDVLRSEPQLPPTMLVHAYGGPADLIRELTAMGAWFSFSGKVLDPRYERARITLAAVPTDRLLIETDAPNMLPPDGFHPHIVPGTDGEECNHPANLSAILRGIADLLGEPQDELQGRVWQNAQRFFGWIRPLVAER